MKPLPYIPENESLTDLLDLVGNSKKFAERVKTLKELQDIINKDLGDRAKVGKLDDLTQQAQSKLSEANRVRTEADAYAKAARDKADSDVRAQGERVKTMQAESEGRFRLLATREKAAAEHERVLMAKDTELAQREKEASALMERAKTLMQSAIETQAQYEAKLAALKQLAAG